MSLVLNGSGTITGATTLASTVTSPTLTTPVITSTLGVGNATPSASGAGITFPATQSASSDPNTLDDYEEGTCSAYLSDGTNNTPATTAYYVKVGGWCWMTFDLYNVNTSGFTTAQLRIAGLPFTSLSAGSANQSAIGTITTQNPILVQVNPSLSYAVLYQNASGGPNISSMTKNDFISSANCSVWGTLMYRTAN